MEFYFSYPWKVSIQVLHVKLNIFSMSNIFTEKIIDFFNKTVVFPFDINDKRDLFKHSLDIINKFSFIVQIN